MPELNESLREPALLTVKDLAARLRVSVRTVWHLLEQSEIPYPVAFGKRILRWREAR